MDDASPAPIMASIFGYLRTAALQAAIRLDLFTKIAEGATGVDALAAACKADRRSVRSLCDYLTSVGHLEKRAEHYALTPSSATFLDRRSPAYLGSIEEFLASPQNKSQALDDPLSFMRKDGGAAEGNLAPDNPVWVAYARAMVPLAAPVARATAKVLAPIAPKARRVLDVAAGSGMFGIEMLRALPEARAVALDWAHVLEVAAENARRKGVGDRLELLPGSAIEIDWGSGYDIVMLPNFLHHFDHAMNVELMRQARAALVPGGRLAVIEFVPDPDRVSIPMIAAFSLMMRVTTPQGDAYTAAELQEMAREAGYERTSFTPLGATLQTLLVAQ
jgi:2-polyprenyl-3-methyl-5-hydroxy-6-metoxy-1,4-benzoquinol methylase